MGVLWLRSEFVCWLAAMRSEGLDAPPCAGKPLDAFVFTELLCVELRITLGSYYWLAAAETPIFFA